MKNSSAYLTGLFASEQAKEDMLIFPFEWLEATRNPDLTAFLSTITYPHWTRVDGSSKLLLEAFEVIHWWDKRKAKILSYRKADSKVRKKWAKKLLELGLIEIEKPTSLALKARLIESKRPQVLTLDNTKQCEWCKCDTLITNKHHFPVPKCNGGQDVVEICPNCHFEYHALEDDLYIRLTQKLKDISKKFIIQAQ